MAIFGNKMFVFKKEVDSSVILDMKFHNNIIDDTGNSVATSNGITFEDGVFSGVSNNSARLNANSDNVIIPDSDLFSFTDGTTDKPFTVEFDVIFHNLGVLDGSFYYKFIVHKRAKVGAANAANDKEWQIRTTNTKSFPRLELTLYDQTNGGVVTYTGSEVLTNSTSYNLCVSYDGNGNAVIKVNGSLVSTSKSTSGSYVCMKNGEAPLKVGSTTWDAALGANMNIENLIIKNI